MNNILHKSTIATYNYQQRDAILNEPRTEQIKCTGYCLRMDHRDGELKGRPIHVATETLATRFFKFLSNSHKNILTHVPAHLKNTQEFVSFISTLDKGFCSLDVSSLYVSIPRNDREDRTPGIFTTVTGFFSKHKAGVHLSEMDFCLLLLFCLTSDVILIKEQGYTKKPGFAMVITGP